MINGSRSCRMPLAHAPVMPPRKRSSRRGLAQRLFLIGALRPVIGIWHPLNPWGGRYPGSAWHLANTLTSTRAATWPAEVRGSADTACHAANRYLGRQSPR